MRGNAQTVEGFAKNAPASSVNRELTRKLANASKYVMPITKMDRASFGRFVEWVLLAEVGEQVLGRVLEGRLIPLSIDILGEPVFIDPVRVWKASNARRYRKQLRAMNEVSLTDVAGDESRCDGLHLTDGEIMKLVYAWEVAQNSPAMPQTSDGELVNWAEAIRNGRAKLDAMFAGVQKPAVDENNRLNFVETTEIERQQLLRAFASADSPSADTMSDREDVQRED